jgi:hypothetical protein
VTAIRRTFARAWWLLRTQLLSVVAAVLLTLGFGMMWRPLGFVVGPLGFVAGGVSLIVLEWKAGMDRSATDA